MSTSTVRVQIGDMFASGPKTLVNTVNCVGIMGKGIAQAFKKRFPKMFEDYARRCAEGTVKPGVPYLYKDMLGSSIINFPTKKHWRSPSKVEDIVRGLDIIVDKYRDWDLESIAFPPLGCGNGGLEWSLVGPIMFQKLSQLEIPVEIYAPYGTPARQLSHDFLAQPINGNHAATGSEQRKLTPEWLSLLEVVYQLEQQPYANPVGRTIFQKICYVMTEQGIDTGFRFRPGSYGPFSDEVKQALSAFANSNLIVECQLGRMTALRTGPEFLAIRSRYEAELKPFQKKIEKTVDLFSRIKDTEQAEEVATVLFAARKLKRDRGSSDVSEQDLYDYILAWKKTWKDDSKRVAIASAIRNLEMLNWMRLDYSESLPASSDFV